MKTSLFGQIRPPKFMLKPDAVETGGENETAGGREVVHIGPEAKKFAQQFKKPLPGDQEQKPPVKVDHTLVKKAEALPPSEEKEAPPDDDASRQREEPPKKPGSNVPKIIEDKKKAELERDQFRAKAEEYETKTLPSLNKQIAELQDKIDGGKLSEAKEAEFNKRIQEIEAAKAQVETSLSEKLTNAEKKLAVFDLVNDPGYKEKYLKPLGQSIEAIRSHVGKDPELGRLMNRAMMAQKEYLQAETREDQDAAADARDKLLQAVLDGCNGVQARRLDAAFTKYMETSEAQAMALADNQKTVIELRRAAEIAQVEGIKQTVQEWSNEYDRVGAKYAADAEFDTEIADKLKEMGIEVNMEVENQFARRAITGDLRKPEVCEILHRGRVYPALTAKIKAQANTIEGLRATVAKLRNAGGGGGDRSGQSAPPAKDAPPVNEDGKDRRDWQKKFRPPGS